MGPVESDELRPAPSSDSLDERALIVEARTDPAAFGALYRRYVERIYAFAYRRTWSPEAAEDVTAATFERALRHIERFDAGGARLGPWPVPPAAHERVGPHRPGGPPPRRPPAPAPPRAPRPPG